MMNSKNAGLTYVVLVMCVVVFLALNASGKEVDVHDTQQPLGFFWWRNKKRKARKLKEAAERKRKRLQPQMVQPMANSVTSMNKLKREKRRLADMGDFLSNLTNNVQDMINTVNAMATTNPVTEEGAERVFEEARLANQHVKNMYENASHYLETVKPMTMPETKYAAKMFKEKVRAAMRQLTDMEHSITKTLQKVTNSITNTVQRVPKSATNMLQPAPQQVQRVVQEIPKMIQSNMLQPAPQQVQSLVQEIPKMIQSSPAFMPRKCKDCFCVQSPTMPSEEEPLGAPLATILTTPFNECRCRSCD